jgi:hypothetical protein
LQETKKGRKKKKEKKLVNSKRQGKGRNTSEVEIEMQWGEGNKRKHMQRKMKKKADQAQEGRISSRGSYPRMALGNGTAVTAWERRIEIVAPRMAVS